MSDAPDATAPPPTWWERSWNVSDRWLPYGLLAASTLISVVRPDQPESWAGTVGLAVLAAAWVALGHTFAAPARRLQTYHAVIYVGGLLALASVLMARDVIFLLFAITAFLHASVLRPAPLVFVGTGATAFLINYLTWGRFAQGPTEIAILASVIPVQTLLIGAGLIGGEKLTRLYEERGRMVGELQQALAENEGLHAQLVAQAREAGIHDERQRMAREIHDTLAQGLAGVITQLEAARGDDTDAEVRRRHLDNGLDVARQSLVAARRSVRAIGPEPLDDRSLPAALEELARRWTELHGVDTAVTTTGEHRPLHPEIEASLLRVVQEALANVAKHAAASHVGVTLSYLDDVVAVDVRDDGCGFDVDEVARTGAGGGFGLTAMRQRAVRLTGSLDIESTPGLGTAVCATVPAVPAEGV